MIKNHGTFNQGEGSRFVNANGVDWANYANSVTEFEVVGPNEIRPVNLPGTSFVTVDADKLVTYVTKDPTSIVPFDVTIVETDQDVTVGMIFASNRFKAGPVVEPVITVTAGDLWERLTNEEAEQVEAAIAAQPVRIRNIFAARSQYRSDHELFPLLKNVAETLFGVDRASAILAPSV